MNTLVLVNSFSPGYLEAREGVLPYLDHFGVPYALLDLACEPLPADVAHYALIVVAHSRLDPGGARLGAGGRRALLQAVGSGAGMVSFDPALPSAAELGASLPERAVWAEAVEFPERPHYITERHQAGSAVPLLSRLKVPPLPAPEATTWVTAGGRPLLAATALGKGRLVQWATAGWMQSAVLGPMAGLDDLVWRSLVWAARKPFALRGLAPLVTMRVDDVSGRGIDWGCTPFYWVREANRHGFKPWLGIFIYNLPGAAVSELRDLIERGQATAFPHAFGMETHRNIADLYYQGEYALPRPQNVEEEFLRRHGRAPGQSDLDEFIYFDHLHKRPWPDGEAARRLAAVDRWYAAQAPLPMSRYALPHWYEMGSNVVGHLQEQWGVEFIGAIMDPDLSYSFERPWLRGGPFRSYGGPRATTAVAPARRGRRPFYYAHWLNLGGRRFFNCLTEVRDDAGYDWRPDNDIAATVGHGVAQLRRALDCMAPAVLFAHETDAIYAIRPEAWCAEIAQVAQGVAPYNPIYVTMDEALRYVRATRTSRLASVRYDDGPGSVSATFEGQADVATHFRLFTETPDGIQERLVAVPAFAGEATVEVSTQTQTRES